MVIQLALLLWVPITIGLFLVLRPHRATAISFIAGLSLLPSLRSFNVPVLPDLDQSSIPTLTCFFMSMFMARNRMISSGIGRGPEILIALMILGALATNLTNMDPVVYGANVLAPMSVVDTVYDAAWMVILWGLPFYLGRALVRTATEAREVLVVLAIAGLLHVPFILVELVTGPLFHRLVYGSYPSMFTFAQSIKFGGFRPVVLMNHGLTLSVFMLYSTIAWLTLAKAKRGVIGVPNTPVVGGLIVVLALCKSVAVYLYGLVALPILYLFKPKFQLAICAMIAVIVLGYPTLRATGVVPVEEMQGFAEEQVGGVAARSMMARLTTEDEILARVRNRIVFGWGGNARYQIFDPVTGQPLSTLDGLWVIVIGEGGAVRFFLLFLLMLYPVFYAYRKIHLIPSLPVQYLICGMAWIVAIRAFDLLPNSGGEAYLTFFSGAMYGVTKFQVARAKSARLKKQERRARSYQPSA